MARNALFHTSLHDHRWEHSIGANPGDRIGAGTAENIGDMERRMLRDMLEAAQERLSKVDRMPESRADAPERKTWLRNHKSPAASATRWPASFEATNIATGEATRDYFAEREWLEKLVDHLKTTIEGHDAERARYARLRANVTKVVPAEDAVATYASVLDVADTPHARRGWSRGRSVEAQRAREEANEFERQDDGESRTWGSAIQNTRRMLVPARPKLNHEIVPSNLMLEL